MKFVDFSMVREYFTGKSVAIVGSGPSALENDHGFIDGHDLVVRVNNYGIGGPLGNRADVFYSFFGGSIKKAAKEVQKDGVKLCMCKCPNSKPLSSEWHESRNKLSGVDFRYIYAMRSSWWFCDTFVPTDEHFLRSFNLLGRHIPTTGFSAIFDVLQCNPSNVFITGFDFFQSKIHNVNKPWREGDPSDPIGHKPLAEYAWIVKNMTKYPIQFDRYLSLRIQKGALP